MVFIIFSFTVASLICVVLVFVLDENHPRLQTLFIFAAIAFAAMAFWTANAAIGG